MTPELHVPLPEGPGEGAAPAEEVSGPADRLVDMGPAQTRIAPGRLLARRLAPTPAPAPALDLDIAPPPSTRPQEGGLAATEAALEVAPVLTRLQDLDLLRGVGGEAAAADARGIALVADVGGVTAEAATTAITAMTAMTIDLGIRPEPPVAEIMTEKRRDKMRNSRLRANKLDVEGVLIGLGIVAIFILADLWVATMCSAFTMCKCELLCIIGG